MKKVAVSATICLILLVLFTSLLIFKYLGAASYSSLVFLSILVGLIIYFKDEIGEIDLKKMKLVLKKTQKIEKHVNGTARAVAEFVAELSTYSSGSWINRKRLNDKIENFLTNIDTDPKESKTILELPRIMEKGMKDMKSLTSEEKKKADNVFKLDE